MASNTTLGAITLAAQQRADMQNGTFIDASEWTAMVNASCQNLWEKLIAAYGSDYEVQTPYELTTDGTNERYALPSDFFKLLGVDLKLTAGTAAGWVTIWRFNFAERNRWSLPNLRGIVGRGNLRYRLSGGNIWFTPLPVANQTLRLWYVPTFTPLVNAADTFDGINGWEEWVINDVAMKALVKEESGIDDVMKLQAIQEERLTGIIDNRDAGAPQTTVDVYAMNGAGWPSPDDWWW